MVLTEIARAKVNLTLRILGRRPDGFHELESLVAFADVGDRLTLDTTRPPGVDVSGPFAAALAGADNLVEQALAHVLADAPGLTLGHVSLEKRLPVAAGIGGGSSDAGAVLRLAARANPAWADERRLIALAAKLGADVPVCVIDRPAVMTGIGARVTALPDLPPLPAVLVNPQVAVPANKTAAVFRQLAAPILRTPADHAAAVADARRIATPDALLDRLAAAGNDLEPAASAVMPVVREVLLRLRTLPNVRLARLSGAGPTCFALFERAEEAETACVMLSASCPTWWVAATRLR